MPGLFAIKFLDSQLRLTRSKFTATFEKIPRIAKNCQKIEASERRPQNYTLQYTVHVIRSTEANTSNNTGSAVLAPHGALEYLWYFQHTSWWLSDSGNRFLNRSGNRSDMNSTAVEQNSAEVPSRRQDLKANATAKLIRRDSIEFERNTRKSQRGKAARGETPRPINKDTQSKEPQSWLFVTIAPHAVVMQRKICTIKTWWITI